MTYQTPWTVSVTEALDHNGKSTVPIAQIVDYSGSTVCQLRGADAAELARRIVRAVNAQADNDRELRERLVVAMSGKLIADIRLPPIIPRTIWLAADAIIKARP